MQAVVRALLERDRGQDVVTVCGVVRHASSPSSSSTRRDSPTATHPAGMAAGSSVASSTTNSRPVRHWFQVAQRCLRLRAS